MINNNIGENNNHADLVRKSVSLPSVRFIWSPFPNARIRAWGPRPYKSLQPTSWAARTRASLAKAAQRQKHAVCKQPCSHREILISENNRRCFAPLTNSVADGATHADLACEAMSRRQNNHRTAVFKKEQRKQLGSAGGGSGAGVGVAEDKRNRLHCD